jgi:hypothetical protein
MLRLLLLLLLNLSLAACAPATLQGLRERPAGQLKFEVAKSYQPVYRTILSNARRCHQTGLITAQMIVQGDLYTDTRTAEITVALHGGLGVDTHLGIDIKALSDESTEVRTFYALSSWKATARAVEAWVRDGSTECRVSP